MIIDIKEAIRCPGCKLPLVQSFKPSFIFAICPQVHNCKRCNLLLLSWVIATYAHKRGERSIAFNADLDELVLQRMRRARVFDYEEILVVTEEQFMKYTNRLKINSVDVILQMYRDEKNRVFAN